MSKILSAYLLVILLLPLQSIAGDRTITANSDNNRVALLELYTSEGCSSCPPADAWLRRYRKNYGNNYREKLPMVPLAYHVTYWNSIGWDDPYSQKIFDDRQYKMAQYNFSRGVYTPQFVLNGSDFRRMGGLERELERIHAKAAPVTLSLQATKISDESLDVIIDIQQLKKSPDEVAVFIALYENDLSSDVTAGENDGEVLQHDYVVRKLIGPINRSRNDSSEKIMQKIQLEKSWDPNNLGLATYVQSVYTGKVLQAIAVNLAEK